MAPIDAPKGKTAKQVPALETTFMSMKDEKVCADPVSRYKALKVKSEASIY
jgi:hypothetical protein